jgi:hypothetical protein
MQVDADPLKKADSMYTELVDVNMVDISKEFVAGDSIGALMPKKKSPEDVEMVTEDHQSDNAIVTEDQLAEKMKVAYPKAEEDLIDFLNRCKITNTKTMLFPRHRAVFDKEVARSIEDFRPQSKRKNGWADSHPKFGFNKRGVPYKMKFSDKNPSRNQKKTFNPPAKSPTDTWVFSGGKRSGYSAPPTKWVKRVTTTPNQKETSNSKQYAYNNNYMGRNPMTKTQWRRYQRQKKAGVLKDITNIGKDTGKQVEVYEMVKRPATERIFPLVNFKGGDSKRR